MTTPDVSVIIAAFNAEATIERSIVSAIRVFGCPVFVVNDGSTDRTSLVAKSVGATVIDQANMGATAARRNGLGLTDSEYVVVLDSDDEVMAGMHQALDLLRSDHSIAVAGGRVELSNSGGPTGRAGPSPRATYSTADLVAAPMSPWPPSASIWRRDSLLASFLVPIDSMQTKYAEDYEMLIRASLVGSVRGVDEFTCLYRAHGGKSSLAALEAIACAETIRLAYASALGLPADPLSTASLRRASSWRVFRAHQVEFGLKKAVVRAARQPRVLLMLAGEACVRALGRLAATVRRDTASKSAVARTRGTGTE